MIVESHSEKQQIKLSSLGKRSTTLDFFEFMEVLKYLEVYPALLTKVSMGPAGPCRASAGPCRASVGRASVVYLLSTHSTPAHDSILSEHGWSSADMASHF